MVLVVGSALQAIPLVGSFWCTSPHWWCTMFQNEEDEGDMFSFAPLDVPDMTIHRMDSAEMLFHSRRKVSIRTRDTYVGSCDRSLPKWSEGTLWEVVSAKERTAESKRQWM